MPERVVRRHMVRLLGSLPVIAHFARRLRIQSTINRLCPSRGNAYLSHGQVALAIFANRLSDNITHYLTGVRLPPGNRSTPGWLTPAMVDVSVGSFQ